MERRNFLKNIMHLAAVPLVSNQLFAHVIDTRTISTEAMTMISDDIDKVLVLIKLHGGNDGLNTIIPLDQYSKLADPKVRGDIIIPENNILKLNGADTLGMHPSMTAMQQLFNDSKLSIIQGVANTAGVFSHFHGIDQWETASDQYNTYSSGWIGRYIEKNYKYSSTHYPNLCMPDPLAIEIATSSLLTRGSGTILSQYMSAGFNGNVTQLLDNYADDNISDNMKFELEFLRKQQSHTIDYGNKITQAWSNGINSVTYPNSNISSSFGYTNPTTLSQQLKIVARLIKGGLKTRIFVVSIGNFDTHKKQGSDGLSWHSLLLKDLSEAIGTFQKDIENMGIAERVVGMTYSEFGRRVPSNSENGTEHGFAAPMFVFGKSVKGGVIGTNYQIDDVSLVNAGTMVPLQFDYRQVYSTILQKWFGICKDDATDVIKKDVTLIDNIIKEEVVIKPCIMGALVDPKDSKCTVSIIDITGDDHELYARIQPNPSNGLFKIETVFGFDYNQPIQISIHNVNGVLIYSNKKYYQEKEIISIDLELSSGIYIVSIQNNKYRLNQKLSIQK